MSQSMVFVILLTCAGQVFAQEYRDYNWQLGQRTYNDTMPYSLVFDFRNSTFSIDLVFRDFEMYLTNSSISDSQGELLVYTNGCAVFDKNHTILVNGDMLNPGIAFETQCGDDNGGYAVAEGAQFINLSDSLFILMHLADHYLSNPVRVFVDRVYATTMRSTGADIEILTKNQLVLIDTLARGIECVRNDSEWWCITQGKYDNQYHIISITDLGEFNVHVQKIGSTPSGQGGGQTAISPDGLQYARFNTSDQLYLFDFDRISGELSNFRYIHVADSGIVGGAAFSASSQYLYISSQFDLYQVDTWAVDVQESVVHIGHFDGYFSPFPATFRLMQLGPDCRIYMIPPNGIDVMHVIHDPDLSGAACNFEQHGIQLPANNTITLPNFPNYRLDIGPPCDPTITGMVEALPKPEPIRIGPNPAADYVNVWTDSGDARLLFFDLQGQIVFSHDIDGKGLHTVELDLPSGMYVFSIVTGAGIRYTGKLVVQPE